MHSLSTSLQNIIRLTLFCLPLSITSLLSHANSGPLEVIYPTLQGGMKAHSFQLSVLKLAMDKSGQEYSIQATSSAMTQGRAIIQLKKAQGVTVLWAGTSQKFEQTMKPIRIPVYMGLLGYRLFLINRERQAEFNSVNDLEGLQKMVAGQGIGWSDSEILKAANLEVVNSLKQNLLLKLINREIDYFPLGVTEVHAEHELYAEKLPFLAVERNLLLHYPFAVFFFVNQDNHQLAKAIEKGLKKALQDGSYQELFNQHPHIQSFLHKTELDSRKHIHIPNPFLTEDTSEVIQQYLFQME